MPERGKYIVIEGNDGTGKSTQVDLLAEHLKSQGVDSYVAHEPSGTPMADAIRTIIKDGSLKRDPETNLLLFTAARREIWQRAKRSLELGQYVLSARNYLSTLAYQGGGEGIDRDVIVSITQQFTDKLYMEPDTTIILSLNDSIRRERIAKRGELEKPDTFESKGSEFQQQVNDTYEAIAREYGYPIIDASISIDEIQQQIRAIVGRR